MDKPSPFYKRWYFWVAIVIWFIVLANVGKKNNTPAQVVAPEAAEEVSVEASQEPDTTEGKITAIIDSLKFNYSDLKIYDNGNKIKISLHYDDTAWNETRLCCACLSDYINICKQAYEMDGIDKIEYYVFVDFTDSKGNEKSEKGFAICMTKDNFNTYNWDNMKCITGSYPQIESDCEFLDIHAGLKKNVDFNEVYYKG